MSGIIDSDTLIPFILSRSVIEVKQSHCQRALTSVPKIITVMRLEFRAFWRHNWYPDTILLPNLHNFVPNLHDWVDVILSNLFWIEQGAILYSYEWGLENLYLSLYLDQEWINCAWECELQCFNLSGDLLPIIGILKEAFFMQFTHSMLPSGISILCHLQTKKGGRVKMVNEIHTILRCMI